MKDISATIEAPFLSAYKVAFVLSRSMNDELRGIPGHPGYSITRDGRVWSDEKFRQRGDGWLIQRWNGSQSKYLSVDLCKEGKYKTRPVHHLVLETFVGARPPGMEACHRDDNRSNNHLDNLYWGTQKQNMWDAKRNGIRLGRPPKISTP